MKLFLTQRPSPRLYLDVMDAEPLMLKSIDPVKWARKFDDKNKEYPKSAADLSDKRHDAGLYLDVDKANPHKEPVKGLFMHGGGGAAKGKGQQDLSALADEMMDTDPKKESKK